jgi:hypothetical protein
MPSQLPNLQKQVSGRKKLHDTDINLSYTFPVLSNGQVSWNKSEKISAWSDKETGNCDSESSVSTFSIKSSHTK